jgi:hypothetical protein
MGLPLPIPADSEPRQVLRRGQVQVLLPSPHPGQRKILREARRFNWLAAGRGYWKTTMCAMIAIRKALLGEQIIWGAPTYDQVRIALKVVRKCAGLSGKFIAKENAIQFLTGGEIIFRSFDDPETKRGFHPHGAVLDECGSLIPDAYYKVIRPMLVNKQGWVWGISSPNGFNWFWKEWNEAKRDPDSMSWQAPTLGAEVTEHGLVRKPHPLENPYIHWTEMESQFRNMTGLAFKQECLGEFIESGGALFPNVDECSIGVYGKERIEGHTYVIGIDIGKSIDFTVISTFDVGRREQVDILRFTGLSFDLQLGRIENQIRKWRPFLIIIESNAAGWAFIDFLTKQGYPVMGFTTSPTTKKDAFDALILAFDQKTISVIRDEQQMVELKSIQPIKLPSGGLKYAGPAEVHDDMVMAMALAWHGVDTFTGSWAAAISRYRESISPSMTRHNTAFITQVLDEEKNVIVAGAIIGFWEDKIVVHEARLLSHAPSEAVKFLMKAPSALVGCDLSCYQYYSGHWADLVDEMMRRDPNLNKSFYALKRPTDVEARQLAALSGTLLDERFILNHTLSDDVISWRLLHTPKSAILDAVAGAVELAGRYGTDE